MIKKLLTLTKQHATLPADLKLLLTLLTEENGMLKDIASINNTRKYYD
jgi:hypothetical protein